MSKGFFAFFCSLVCCFFLSYQHYRESVAINPKLSVDQILLDALPLKMKKGDSSTEKVVEKVYIEKPPKIIEKVVYVVATPTTDLGDKPPRPPIGPKPPPDPIASGTNLTSAVKLPVVASKTFGLTASGSLSIPPPLPVVSASASQILVVDTGSSTLLVNLASQSLTISSITFKVTDESLYWGCSPESTNPFVPALAFVPRERVKKQTEEILVVDGTIPDELAQAMPQTDPGQQIKKLELANIYQGSISSGNEENRIYTALLSGRAYNVGDVFPNRGDPDPKEIVTITDSYVMFKALKSENTLFFAFSVRLEPDLLQKFRIKFIQSA